MTDSRSARSTEIGDPDRILEPLESWGVRLGLDRVERILERFGRPQESYATVLVAGTNGKGSTAALLASMVASAGYRTGLFTSPHLEGVEERLRLDGVAIAREGLANLLIEVVERAEAGGLEPPTYFEALTVAANLWFSRSGVDLAVFEVGMGGRLDATNTCSPVLSVVSEIGLDHTKSLGNSLEEIAREKAGIFRSGAVAISGAGEPKARSALERCAREIGSAFVHAADLIRRIDVEEKATSQLVHVETTRGSYDLDLGLAGEHQVRNLVLALVAAEYLSASGRFDLDRWAIERGVRGCVWPGRLERILLPTNRTVWLDVAHNPQGAETLSRFVCQRLADYDLLLGVLEDKDARGVLGAIASGAGRITLTRPPSVRGLDPRILAALLPGRPRVRVAADPSAALDVALEGERPLVVCGSLYLVGFVRKALRERFGVPASAADLIGRSASRLVSS